jgi:hypothetical protein
MFPSLDVFLCDMALLDPSVVGEPHHEGPAFLLLLLLS